MTKFESHGDYPLGGTAMAEKALLTAWDSMASFQEEIVLIGGLAIRYLTNPPQGEATGPVTVDVDFAVKIGVGGGMYSTIRQTMASHGFRWIGGRFTKEVDGLPLYVDLLTDDESTDAKSVIVDDGLEVSVTPGIQSSLNNYRVVDIEGENMVGVHTSQKVKVAEVGPMLVLKLNAFGGPTGRKAGKDAHDILYLVNEYKEGVDKAIEGFRSEVASGNRGAAYAIACLKEHFSAHDAMGPMSCAAFRMNQAHRDPEREQESMMIRQQCVTLAEHLLEGHP